MCLPGDNRRAEPTTRLPSSSHNRSQHTPPLGRGPAPRNSKGLSRGALAPAPGLLGAATQGCTCMRDPQSRKKPTAALLPRARAGTDCRPLSGGRAHHMIHHGGRSVRPNRGASWKPAELRVCKALKERIITRGHKYHRTTGKKQGSGQDQIQRPVPPTLQASKPKA